ncbi:MAG: hypothetical protein GY822_24060 [Deltaproteobacteria bacterium]|nr:hypothetical protein [Deltaproteobacteria bacterium]
MDAVLWWHLHQPDYRDPLLDESRLPWVRMHAMRAYTDLVTVAKEDGLRGMTLNLVPSLMDQLQDLGQRKNEDRHLKTAKRFLDGEPSAKVDAFFLHAVPTPLPLYPLEHFEPLREKAARGEPPKKQEAVDAIVLFHLSWVGFTLGRDDRILSLFEKGKNFSMEDARYVMDLSTSTCAWVLPRMRNAQDDGVLHLTCTPYFHPILPLVFDGRSAERCTTVQKPMRYRNPGNAALHVELACRRFEQVFGARPRAMWPAEGALSEEVLSLFADAGVELVASDEELLRKSLPDDVNHPQHAHLQQYEHEPSGMGLLFRDRRLSDDWGFVYRDLQPQEAADAFFCALESKREAGAKACAIILDGENPFENFPFAGRDHLRAIAAHSKAVQWVHPADLKSERLPLERLATGSWIHASFDIWAGDEEDREAWDLLHMVRNKIDLSLLDEERRERVRTHLMAAEGSDWFWWYGPEFSCLDREHFDALFRGHLMAAVLAAGLDIKSFPALKTPIERKADPGQFEASFPAGTFSEGTQLRSVNVIFSETVGSQEDGGAMHRAAPLIQAVQHRVHRDGHDLLVAVRHDVDEAFVRVHGANQEQVVLEKGWLDKRSGAQIFQCRLDRTDVEHAAEGPSIDVVARCGAQEEKMEQSHPLAQQGRFFFEA